MISCAHFVLVFWIQA